MELTTTSIENKIYTVRGMQVMLDYDLATFQLAGLGAVAVANCDRRINTNKFAVAFYQMDAFLPEVKAKLLKA
jgi:hypothetical protein